MSSGHEASKHSDCQADQEVTCLVGLQPLIYFQSCRDSRIFYSLKQTRTRLAAAAELEVLNFQHVLATCRHPVPPAAGPVLARWSPV